MKKDFFVIGDVHGKFELLLDILKKWDEKRQQLIFLGDLIDRGENSKACLELVWQLVREKGAICLTGNHERMFLGPLGPLRSLSEKWWRYDYQFFTGASLGCTGRWPGGCQYSDGTI
ncbi:metallophosphoesterase [Streptococcus suis]|uniref:metallophosphoesterase n=1 Tax=Streptococcus suis TaxID=1307 RepID=UPI000DD90E64